MNFLIKRHPVDSYFGFHDFYPDIKNVKPIPGKSKEDSETLESHLQVLKHCLKFREEVNIIIEDDVLFRKSYNINDIIADTPEDWDVIYLGGMNHYHPPEIIDDKFYRCRYSFNSHCYVVNLHFIPTLINHVERRDSEVDVIFAKMQENRIGNWYGILHDMVIPTGRFKHRFVTSSDPDVFSSDSLTVSKLPHSKRQYDIFCELTSKIPLGDALPRINKNSKKKSLIIDGRIEKNTEFTIRNTIRCLGDGWGHIVITSPDAFADMKKLCKSISNKIEVRKVKKMSSRNDYNNLLLNLSFWQTIDAQYLLIYQTDCLILNALDDKYFKYDYVGSPWNKHSEYIYDALGIDVKVGNGGLSLRNVKSMRQALKKDDPLKYNTDMDHTLDKCPEDLYFSFVCDKIATVEDAEQFAIEPIGADSRVIEVEDIKNLFGSHRIYDAFNWKSAVVDYYYNKVYMISGVYSGGSALYLKHIKNNIDTLKIKQVNKRKKLKRLKEGDVLLLQHFIGTDIQLYDIIQLGERGIRIMILIQDYHLFAPNESMIRGYGEYTYAEPRCPIFMPKIKEIFDISECVICNSKYTEEFFKRTDFGDKVINIHPIDQVEERVVRVPEIKEKIKIGVIANITLFKGYPIYSEIFSKKEFEEYQIEYHIFGENKFDYDNVINHGGYQEDDIYRLIKDTGLHGLLYFNVFPETHGFAATKGINSGLPIAYNLVGAHIERFEGLDAVFSSEFGNEVESFNNMLSYIIDCEKSKTVIFKPKLNMYSVSKLEEVFNGTFL